MRLALINHERCQEHSASTYVWVPDEMSDADVAKAVKEAKAAYLKFLESWKDESPPNNLNRYGGGPKYADYPDLKVSEVQAMYEKQREEYNAWQRQRDQAREPFSYYLRQQGLKEFWEHRPDLELNVDWGHRHGLPIDYSDTDVSSKDLPGPKPSGDWD